MRTTLAVLALAIGGLSPSFRAEAQGMSSIERARAQAMLGGLTWVLDTLYYDSTKLGDGSLGANLWWRARQTIDTVSSWPGALLALATFLEGFRDSHTSFLPPRLTMEVDFGWSWRVVGEQSFVTEVRRNGPADRAGLMVGDRIVNVDGIAASPQNMGAVWFAYHLIAPRRNMRVVVQAPDGSRRPVEIEGRVRQRPATTDYGNIHHVRGLIDEMVRSARIDHRWRVRDSVAVWRFNAFGFNDRGIDQRMREARRFPWLILDLRGNGGGVLATLERLLGHFFEEAFDAFEQRWRDSTSAYRVRPVGEPYRGQVLVLLDRESASSAEIFAHVMRERGRARLLGDRSAGAVRTSIRFNLEDQASGQFYEYGMFVTVADVRMADGAALEGVGVVPDIELLPTGADIAAGRDPVLQRALEIAGVRLSAEEAARILR